MSWDGTTFPEVRWGRREMCWENKLLSDWLIEANGQNGWVSPLQMRTFPHMDMEEVSAKSGSRKLSTIAMLGLSGE